MKKNVQKHNTTITATTIVEYEKKITIPKTTQEAFLMEMHSPVACASGTFTFDYHLICEIGMQCSAMQCNAVDGTIDLYDRPKSKDRKKESE